MPRSSQFAIPELDLHRYELRLNGDRVRLEKIPMELFIFLVEKRDNLVSREAIVERLWGKGVFLDTEQGINTAVRKIRQALHDDPERPQFLQTVIGKGYRFVGPVKVVGDGIAVADGPPAVLPAAVVQPPVEEKFHQPSRWKSKALVGSLLALALATLEVWNTEVHRQRLQPGIRSIAVLPLQNLSGDAAQEYFADGTTEELTTTLAKLTDLKVISRTSAMRLKGVQESVKEIGRDLDVDAIVEGSVARFPKTVRITVQVIDVRSDTHLWAGEYEDLPDEILRLQQKVAREIAVQVSAKIAPSKEGRAAIARPVDSNAHDLYLKGRFFAGQGTAESLTQSIELYEQAINLQPDYAAAYSGLAEAFASRASQWDDAPDASIQRSREAALKALTLDESTPGARRVLAWIKHAYDWDTAGAEALFQGALKINGYDADTHSLYASFLADIGRIDEGLAEARLAEDLDPRSVRSSVSGERVLMRGRRFEEFLKQAQRSRKLDPNSVLTSVHLVIVYEDLGRFEDAINEFETHSISVDPAETVMIRARQLRAGLRQEGPKGYWRVMLRTQAKNNPDDHRNMAHLYLMLGDNDAGLHELDLAVQQRDPAIRFDIKSSPWWDPVRNDPHFEALLRKVGY